MITSCFYFSYSSSSFSFLLPHHLLDFIVTFIAIVVVAVKVCFVIATTKVFVEIVIVVFQYLVS